MLLTFLFQELLLFYVQHLLVLGAFIIMPIKHESLILTGDIVTLFIIVCFCSPCSDSIFYYNYREPDSIP